MPGYWLSRAKVIDPVRYMKYAKLVPDIIAKYGGKVHVRGGPHEVVEGPHHFTRYIVIEFPSFAHARDCYHSPEYQAARRHRLDGAGDVEIVLVEGGEHTSAESLSKAASA